MDAIKLAFVVADLQQDVDFLYQGQISSIHLYNKALNTANTSTEKLKGAAWDAHEYQELLQLAQTLLSDFQECVDDPAQIPHIAKCNRDSFLSYLKNLFKKKRCAASHVLVIMVAEEKRSRKPYALPVQYIPYGSIRDQELRDVLASVKTVMTNMGMKVVGKLSHSLIDVIMMMFFRYIFTFPGINFLISCHFTF